MLKQWCKKNKNKTPPPSIRRKILIEPSEPSDYDEEDHEVVIEQGDEEDHEDVIEQGDEHSPEVADELYKEIKKKYFF